MSQGELRGNPRFSLNINAVTTRDGKSTCDHRNLTMQEEAQEQQVSHTDFKRWALAEGKSVVISYLISNAYFKPL